MTVEVLSNNVIDLNLLEVGDQVAYVSAWTRDWADAKPVTVSRLTATRVGLTYTNFQGNADELVFMKKTRREVGNDKHSWSSSSLITIQQWESAKQEREAKTTLRKTVSEIEDVLSHYKRYSRENFKPEDKQKLLDLVNSLEVSSEHQ